MATTGTEDKLLEALARLESEASVVKKRFNQYVQENLGQVRGDGQWKMRTRKPYFLYNVIQENIDNKVGKLSETKPKVRILPLANGLSAVADILGTSTDYVWNETSAEAKLERAAHFGAVMGTAFIETRWNPSLRFGQGEIEMFLRDPRTVRFDPMIKDPSELKAAQYVIWDEIVPLSVIQAEYPGRGALVIPDSRNSVYDEPDTTAQGRVKSAAQTLQKRGSQGRGLTIPRAVIKTHYIVDRRSSVEDMGFNFPILDGITEVAPGNGTPFPGGRRIITAMSGNGPVVLHDSYNKYWDGEWPIDMLAWNIDVESAWGPDDVQRQIKTQEAINRLGDAYVGNALKNAIIRYVVDRGAIDPQELKKFAEDAAEIIYKNPGRTLERAVPPPLPAEMLGFISSLIDLTKRNIGVLDPQLEKKMPSIVTGPAIEGLQVAMEGSIRTASRRMEEFIQRIGNKIVSRIFQYWNSPRLIHFVGTTGEWREFEFHRSQLLMMKDPKTGRSKPRSIEELQKAYRDFRFVVEPGSSLAVTKVQRAMMRLEMFKVGGMRLSKVMEEMGIENPEEEIEKAREEREKYGLTPPEEGDGRKKGNAMGGG